MKATNILAGSLLGGLIILLSSQPVIAMPEDRNQPIHIQSNQAERDDKRGITTYSGDVVIDQGTMHIVASKVVIETVNNEVSRIIATGRPARMKQRPSPNKEIVHAQGNTITYNLEKDVMTLQDSASIKQQGSIVNSERIDYFIANERVTAQGSKVGGKGSGRVEMIIPAKKAQPK